jgi:hypothetical protein
VRGGVVEVGWEQACQGLCAGDVVDGGDHPALDLEILVYDLDGDGRHQEQKANKAQLEVYLHDGSETVGRARSGGADGHVGSELVVIDSDDNVQD